MTKPRFEVKKVIKFGMLFGYAVYDNKKNAKTPYEYGDDEEYLAQSKCELLNALKG